VSDVIHIWDQPTPASWEEARALLARLLGRAAPPNSKFVALADRVKSTFPDVADDWTLSAPNGDLERAVWSLELGDIDNMYRPFVDAALAFGLTVYLEQSGECLVPGGWRLSAQGREPLTWPAAKPDLVAPLDLQSRVRAVVSPRLAPLGFELRVDGQPDAVLETHWLRATPLGEQSLSLAWKSLSATACDVAVMSHVRPELPDELLPLCKPQRVIRLRVFDPKHRYAATTRLANAAQLDIFLDSAAGWMATELVPVLDACRTMSGFLAYDFDEPRQPITLEPFQPNLVLAFWAGMPDLEQRYERLMQRCVQVGRMTQFLNESHKALQAEGLRRLFGAYRGSNS
jgi:hypothetical protein